MFHVPAPIVPDAQRSNLSAIASALRAIVGDRHLLQDPEAIQSHVIDWRRRFTGEALCVVLPKTAEDVSRVVKTCSEMGVAIVPQGGNTGMCGGAIPQSGQPSVVVAMRRMNRIRNVDPVDGTLEVEAGCTLGAAQAAAERVDRLLPLSLGSEGSCQIGGNIATNAGGTSVLRYGPMRDLVLGIEAVLPNGAVFRGLNRLRKDNTGYDLKHLLIGSEGTLGIVTAAVLRLFPRMPATATAFLALGSLDNALDILGRLLVRFGGRVANFEVMSAGQYDLVLRTCPETRPPLPPGHAWYALLEVDDTGDANDLPPLLEGALTVDVEAGRVENAVVATSVSQGKAFWSLRHAVTEANMSAGYSVSHDTSVPVSAVPAFNRNVEAALKAALPDALVNHVGHLGDGNIHVVVILPRDRYSGSGSIERAFRTAGEIVDRETLALGGSISAEHGIGQSNVRRLCSAKEPVALDLMRQIKSLLDPQGIMNPGKLF